MSSDSYSTTDSDPSQTIIPSTEILEKDFMLLKEQAVWRALIANLGIAAIKLICWFMSRSSAMLSEAIHSAVDSFNSLCLIVGLDRGNKPADKMHPFGYGLEANVWALFACIIMLGGAAISLYSGGNRLFSHSVHSLEMLEHYNLILVTLLASIGFELMAVASASRAVVAEAEVKANSHIEAFFLSIKYIHQIKSPTTKFVWYEDTAALAGATIALIALTISKFFVHESFAYIPDAIASIFIGLMLLGLAIYLLRYNVNFLTGASAKPDVEEKIKKIASKVTGVSQVLSLRTMDMGASGLIINMEIEVDPEIPVKDADDIADKLEKKLLSKIRNVSYITIEVEANEAEENWNEKFNNLIKEGKNLNILNETESAMLSRFFDFTDTVVNEIMIPRTDVVFVDTESSMDELIDTIICSGHTRIPLYKESVDNLIGVINAKDVLKSIKNCEKKEDINIEELAREITIVPENKSISDMLSEFNSNKTQIAAVVDEHGGVAGIVTVEDVLEEIVGEIWDEYDVEIPEIISIDEKTLSVYSKMDIEDLNEKFYLDIPIDDFQTIGGYVFGLLGREPAVGDEVESNDMVMKVENMDGHKIIRVLLYKENGFKEANIIEK